MRRIHEVILMGNGLMSLGEAYKVHKILAEAFSNLGAIQQLAHSSSEEEAKMAEKARKRMIKEHEDSVRDIVMALTGKEIRFE